MTLKVDLEREFFKVAKNLETYEEVKKQFLERINEISDKWLDSKFRLGILGLKDKDNEE